MGALDALVHAAGIERGRYLMQRLEARAKALGLLPQAPSHSAYRNTIALEQQAHLPGDVELEERITAMVRWNALAMVVRANKAYGELTFSTTSLS